METSSLVGYSIHVIVIHMGFFFCMNERSFMGLCIFYILFFIFILFAVYVELYIFIWISGLSGCWSTVLAHCRQGKRCFSMFASGFGWFSLLESISGRLERIRCIWMTSGRIRVPVFAHIEACLCQWAMPLTMSYWSKRVRWVSSVNWSIAGFYWCSI